MCRSAARETLAICIKLHGHCVKASAGHLADTAPFPVELECPAQGPGEAQLDQTANLSPGPLPPSHCHRGPAHPVRPVGHSHLPLARPGPSNTSPEGARLGRGHPVPILLRVVSLLGARRGRSFMKTVYIYPSLELFHLAQSRCSPSHCPLPLQVSPPCVSVLPCQYPSPSERASHLHPRTPSAPCRPLLGLHVRGSEARGRRWQRAV